jgi:hypothetical protein
MQTSGNACNGHFNLFLPFFSAQDIGFQVMRLLRIKNFDFQRRRTQKKNVLANTIYLIKSCAPEQRLLFRVTFVAI